MILSPDFKVTIDTAIVIISLILLYYPKIVSDRIFISINWFDGRFILIYLRTIYYFRSASYASVFLKTKLDGKLFFNVIVSSPSVKSTSSLLPHHLPFASCVRMFYMKFLYVRIVFLYLLVLF